MKRCRHCYRTKENSIKCMCKKHKKLQKLKVEMDKITHEIIKNELEK